MKKQQSTPQPPPKLAVQSPPSVQQQLKELQKQQNPLQHQSSGLGGMTSLISQNLQPGFQISKKEQQRLSEGMAQEKEAEEQQEKMTRKEELDYEKAQERSLLSQ